MQRSNFIVSVTNKGFFFFLKKEISSFETSSKLVLKIVPCTSYQVLKVHSGKASETSKAGVESFLKGAFFSLSAFRRKKSEDSQMWLQPSTVCCRSFWVTPFTSLCCLHNKSEVNDDFLRYWNTRSTLIFLHHLKEWHEYLKKNLPRKT